MDPGFKSARVLTVKITLPDERYAGGTQGELFFRQLLERLESLPGVVSAGVSTDLPLAEGADISTRLTSQSNRERILPDYAYITPHYFQAIKDPLLKGSFFKASDTDKVIVNEAFVRACTPDRDPIGQFLTVDGIHKSEIVAVVRDIRGRALGVPAKPHIYWPLAVTEYHGFHLFLRTPVLIPGRCSTTFRSVRAIDADVPVAKAQTMDEVVSEHLASDRWLTTLAVAFALVALLLAAMGVYGVMAQIVLRRTQEIGVRVALGAQRREVMGLVLKQGMTTVSIGLVLGGAGDLGAGETLLMSQNLLFETRPTDAATLTGVVLLLLSASFLACYFPARPER